MRMKVDGLERTSSEAVEALQQKLCESKVARGEVGTELLPPLSPLQAAGQAEVQPAVADSDGAISEAEYQALQDLYLATGGAKWTWHIPADLASPNGASLATSLPPA